MAMKFVDDCTALYVVEYNQAGIQAGVTARNQLGETIYNFLNSESAHTVNTPTLPIWTLSLFAKSVGHPILIVTEMELPCTTCGNRFAHKSINTAEHYIEKNLFAKFVKAAIEGNLAGGGTFTAIPGSFFQNFMNTNQAALANIPTMPGAQAETLPRDRLMWTLGSHAWPNNFLLLQARLNLMKAAVSVSPKTPG